MEDFQKLTEERDALRIQCEALIQAIADNCRVSLKAHDARVREEALREFCAAFPEALVIPCPRCGTHVMHRKTSLALDRWFHPKDACQCRYCKNIIPLSEWKASKEADRIEAAAGEVGK